jgi:carbamoyltransferase
MNILNTITRLPSCFTFHKIRPEKRVQICAVNHVDNTGRLQTVSREENPLYYDLIQAFERKPEFR